MSWDSYLDNLIGHTKDASGQAHCDAACIVGQDGSKWTTDGHAKSLKITPAEVQALANCVKTKNFSALQASGVYVAGVKYQFLRSSEDAVYAKKKEQGAITIMWSKTAMVIGWCPEGMQQGFVNKGVAVISEYLASLGM